MLSERIKTLRKKKGMSQEELALKVHVVRQTISKWENALSVPDADELIHLAKGILVDLDEEWVMLEVEVKKKKVVKMFRIDNISSIKEIL